MDRQILRIGLKSTILFLALGSPLLAQTPPQTLPMSPPCACGRYHTNPAGPQSLQGATRHSSGMRKAPNGVSDPGAYIGLPRGRRYYGGRFFGSFNDRFYGPQYGNF